jgi:RNA polymerase sigma-70 factor (ECF subfamily)
MGRPEDGPVIEGLAEGRDDAFAALYDRYGPLLLRAAHGLLGSRPDAEDAVQEVFVGIVRVRHTLAGVENPRAYLLTALRHAAAKIIAGRGRENAIPLADFSQVAAPSPRSLASEHAVRLERALQALPAEQRELIALKVDGGLTFSEVATLLDISPNTAASRYRYALEKLRAALQE